MARRKRRWSDNDTHFGPFTFSRDRARRIGVMLDSGEEEYPGCCLRIHAFKQTIIVELPAILRPKRWKVIAAWDAETVSRLGRNWYFDEHAREFGVLMIDDALHFHYGAQTQDSTTDRVKVWFVPWMNWRHVRHSIYGLSGEHLRTQASGEPWDAWHETVKACPSASFDFDDFDGERIVAVTHIEEREWRLGTGWFKWLSAFRRPRITRSLSIEFSRETGPRKGSWKGGTIGHGIDMLRGELHEATFRRYCSEHKMRFVGVSAPAMSERIDGLREETK